MKYDFISIGGSTQDVYLYAERGKLFLDKEENHDYYGFRFGGKSMVTSTHFFFGGGAANTSVSFASFGFNAQPITAIGHDHIGEAILKNLEDHNVNTEFCQKYKREKSGYSVIVLGPGHEHILFTYRGANNLIKLGEKESHAIKSSKWVYISSLSGEWEKLIKKVFSLKKSHIAWNPGGIQLKAKKEVLQKFLKNITVLILNNDEASDLAKLFSKQKLDNEKAMKLIQSMGPQYVLMTEGAEGAHLYDGKKFYFQKALRKKHITDTTGAGDAFGSGFVAGMEIYNYNIEKAMKLAALNSYDEIGVLGPQRELADKKDALLIKK